MTVQTTVMTKARTAFNQALDGILADLETAFLVGSIDGINSSIIYEEIGTLPTEPKSIVSITRCEADIQFSFPDPDGVNADLIPEIVHKYGAHLIDKGVIWHPCPANSSMEVVTFNVGQEKAWSGDHEGQQ